MTKDKLGDLIIQSWDSLYRISRTILSSDADCEDAVSAMIVTCFSKIYQLREDRYAKTWMTRILINECYTIIRKQKQIISLDDPDVHAGLPPEKQTDPVGEAIESSGSSLFSCVRKLEAQTRMTMVLYYIEGFEIDEIARIMHCRPGTVKSRLSRGRKKLKTLYEEEMGNETAGLVY